MVRDGDAARLPHASGARGVRIPLPLSVIGVGKAAARMALGCERALGSDAVRGIVLTADGCEVPLRSIACRCAGHPLPDQRGLDSTSELVATLERSRGDVVFLLSGGASSLLVRPRPPVTLEEKVHASRLLLDCGADIAEFNTVRKHLSLAKGGGLLRCTESRVWTFILSDVVGDDPAVIGSGPTVPDPTTYADALDVLARYDLLPKVAASVREVLEAGCRGEIEETVKDWEPAATRACAQVIGSNAMALRAAADELATRGWAVRIVPPLEGDTRLAARHWAVEITRELEHWRKSGRRAGLLAGGETTVQVTGGGRGGRNQEFALELAGTIEGQPVAVLSAGSDGIDGPTDAAGAVVDGTTAARARATGLDAVAALAGNDSYAFFDALGDLFRPGPTGTNVMDLKFALVGGA